MKDHGSGGETGVVVKKRHVFFVPGYDPQGARRYRELYRNHCTRQADISGYEIEMQGRPGREGYRWDLRACIDGETTQTSYTVLGWSGIVRDSMDHSIARTYYLLLKTAWIYVHTGALMRLFRLRPVTMIAALYPVVMLMFQACLAIALAFACYALLGGAVGALIGLGLATAVLILFKRYDPKLFAHYLMHDYAFSAQFLGQTPPILDHQLARFRNQISEALTSNVDEVLVVGHSSGAHLAVSLVADILRDRKKQSRRPVLSLLTLGQVIPMISFLPNAKKLRRDLNMLARASQIAWIDVSAPGDGGSFALCDPVHVTGVAPPEGEKLWPKVLSAKFSLTLSPETLRQTRWRFFRRHVQYLCAFERPQEYDYFQITAGPRSLEERFAWRGATKSRRETALSAYRDF